MAGLYKLSHYSTQVIGADNCAVNSDAEQESFLTAHLSRIRDHPNFSNCPIVTVIERCVNGALGKSNLLLAPVYIICVLYKMQELWWICTRVADCEYMLEIPTNNKPFTGPGAKKNAGWGRYYRTGKKKRALPN